MRGDGSLSIRRNGDVMHRSRNFDAPYKLTCFRIQNAQQTDPGILGTDARRRLCVMGGVFVSADIGGLGCRQSLFAINFGVAAGN